MPQRSASAYVTHGPEGHVQGRRSWSQDRFRGRRGDPSGSLFVSPLATYRGTCASTKAAYCRRQRTAPQPVAPFDLNLAEVPCGPLTFLFIEWAETLAKTTAAP